MIRQVHGTVVGIEQALVILEVNGIGYAVRISEPVTSFPLQSTVTLHTHLAVRENALDLYGFTNRDLLEIFELLITLPKIGPKSAQQILTQADITLLKQAVRTNDPSYLSKMSGIGKKSAEKIVSGLREKFDDAADVAFGDTKDSSESTIAYAHDTIDALVALGYPQDEARRMVRKIAETDPHITTSPQALKAALKQLGG